MQLILKWLDRRYDRVVVGYVTLLPLWVIYLFKVILLLKFHLPIILESGVIRSPEDGVLGRVRSLVQMGGFFSREGGVPALLRHREARVDGVLYQFALSVLVAIEGLDLYLL